MISFFENLESTSVNLMPVCVLEIFVSFKKIGCSPITDNIPATLLSVEQLQRIYMVHVKACIGQTLILMTYSRQSGSASCPL